MSRTFRRNKGNRHWAVHGAKDDYMNPGIWIKNLHKFDSYEEFAEYGGFSENYYNKVVLQYETDGINGRHTQSDMKNHTNEIRRMKCKHQISCFYKQRDDYADMYDFNGKWNGLSRKYN